MPSDDAWRILRWIPTWWQSPAGSKVKPPRSSRSIKGASEAPGILRATDPDCLRHRVSLGAHLDARQRAQPGAAVRPRGRGRGRPRAKDREEESDLPALPPARLRPQARGGRAGQWRKRTLPDSAFRRQRQVRTRSPGSPTSCRSCTTRDDRRVFDSIVVVTDRRVLDRQLQRTVRQFEQTSGIVENIDQTSRQLKEALEAGKTIIVTTLQKFPVIAKEIGELPGKRFALIVDEAHSSQSGESTRS